nr:seroin 3 [Yponomeuta cagnagella]
MKLTILFLGVATFAVCSAFDFKPFPPMDDLFKMDDFKMPKMPNKDDIANLGSDGKGVVQGMFHSQSSHTEMKDGKVVSQGSKSDDLVNDNRNVSEVQQAAGDN